MAAATAYALCLALFALSNASGAIPLESQDEAPAPNLDALLACFVGYANPLNGRQVRPLDAANGRG